MIYWDWARVDLVYSHLSPLVILTCALRWMLYCAMILTLMGSAVVVRANVDLSTRSRRYRREGRTTEAHISVAAPVARSQFGSFLVVI